MLDAVAGREAVCRCSADTAWAGAVVFRRVANINGGHRSIRLAGHADSSTVARAMIPTVSAMSCPEQDLVSLGRALQPHTTAAVHVEYA